MVELRVRVLRWGRGWLRLMWRPNPVTMWGSWTRLTVAGYFPTGLWRWVGGGILKNKICDCGSRVPSCSLGEVAVT